MNCIEANQAIHPQRQQFATRLYEWAERDLQREMDADFPRVRKVKSSRAFHYLDFLRSLPLRDRFQAAFALFRSRHNKFLARSGQQPLTPAEQSFVAKFQERFYPIAFRSESEDELLSKTPPEDFEIDANEFEDLVKRQISRVLELSAVPNRACSFIQHIGCWHMRTSVDVHSIFQLRYGHSITARATDDLCPVQLLEYGSTSLLTWLGIHPETHFDLLRRREMQETAVFIAEVVHQFVSAVPELLTGLTHEIPEELEPPKKRLAKKGRKARPIS